MSLARLGCTLIIFVPSSDEKCFDQTANFLLGAVAKLLQPS
jgi:hypothetical protein